jgi:hypothetical protein
VDLERVVPLVVDFLGGEGHPVALVGALALHAHGVTRATVDLDLVTLREAQPALVAFLEGAGYETLHRSEGYSNHAHGDPALGRVDVIYVDPATGRHLFGGSRVQLDIAGRRLPVPRAEHLIAMKVQAIKNDPRRAFKDLADVQALMRLPEIDEAEVRGYFARAGLEARYDELKRLL